MCSSDLRPNDLLRTAGAASGQYGEQLNSLMGQMGNQRRFAGGGGVKAALKKHRLLVDGRIINPGDVVKSSDGEEYIFRAVTRENEQLTGGNSGGKIAVESLEERKIADAMEEFWNTYMEGNPEDDLAQYLESKMDPEDFAELHEAYELGDKRRMSLLRDKYRVFNSEYYPSVVGGEIGPPSIERIKARGGRIKMAGGGKLRKISKATSGKIKKITKEDRLWKIVEGVSKGSLKKLSNDELLNFTRFYNSKLQQLFDSPKYQQMLEDSGLLGRDAEDYTNRGAIAGGRETFEKSRKGTYLPGEDEEFTYLIGREFESRWDDDFNLEFQDFEETNYEEGGRIKMAGGGKIKRALQKIQEARYELIENSDPDIDLLARNMMKDEDLKQLGRRLLANEKRVQGMSIEEAEKYYQRISRLFDEAEKGAFLREKAGLTDKGEIP